MGASPGMAPDERAPDAHCGPDNWQLVDQEALAGLAQRKPRMSPRRERRKGVFCIMLIFKLPFRLTAARELSVATCLLILLSSVVTLSCRSQPGVEKTAIANPTPSPVMIGPPGYPPPVLGKPYPGTGVVTTVNMKEGWISIEHEDIKDLMPAMAMEFWVRDTSIMKGVRVGDRIDFVVVEDSKGQYLTEIKKAPKP